MVQGRSIRRVVMAGAAILAGCTTALAGEHNRAFIELFTSQGCSSCPPADALMSEFQHDPDLITVSLPVDYWDYIGWKDTLAQPDFSKRQKAYAMARGDNHVYTPQVVVNGVTHVVGSDRGEILAAARSSFGEKGAMMLQLALQSDSDKLTVDAGEALFDSAKWGALWLMHIARARTVAIGRGENTGKTITYTNVVRDIRKIGDWNGHATRYEIPAADLKTSDSDGYALVLQASSGGRIGPVLAAVTKFSWPARNDPAPKE